MQSSVLDTEGSKEKFHFSQAPNTVKIGFCPVCFAKRFFQPKRSMRPLPLTVGPRCCQRAWAPLQPPLPGQAQSLVGLIILLYCKIYESVYVHLLH